jgi:hypothetical protein
VQSSVTPLSAPRGIYFTLTKRCVSWWDARVRRQAVQHPFVGVTTSRAARTSAEAAQNERATGVTDEEWWSALGPLMAQYIDQDRYPTLASISAEGWAFEEAEGGGFEFGLRRVLDGIETYVESHSSRFDQG